MVSPVASLDYAMTGTSINIVQVRKIAGYLIRESGDARPWSDPPTAVLPEPAATVVTRNDEMI